LAVPVKHCLILGGTAEARALASLALQELPIKITSSLAGVTTNPNLPEGDIRQGGFGGSPGLVDYLKSAAIDLVVDATHPFAAKISQNAREACNGMGIPFITLERPPWQPSAKDNWRHAANTQEAANLIAPNARALLTIGKRGLAPFISRDDVTWLIRSIEPLNQSIPAHAQNLIARAPFTIADEKALFAQHDIDTLVTKNSGGDATVAKLQAARDMGLQVIMINRPTSDRPPDASNVEEAIELMRRRIS